jgi:hypothetical protein
VEWWISGAEVKVMTIVFLLALAFSWRPAAAEHVVEAKLI